MCIKNADILLVQGDNRIRKTDFVIEEILFSIYVNNELLVRLVCLPKELEELAVGYLLGEGRISVKEDILSIKIVKNETENAAYVELEEGRNQLQKKKSIRAVGTGLGAPGFDMPDGQIRCARGNSVPARCIMEYVQNFNQTSELFQQTGGVHSCALYDKTGRLYFCEDIGRHNAVDKILGHACLDAVNLEECFLITSGRVPLDMVVKAVRSGIVIMISRSAPTDRAIELAQKTGFTLVCFARGDRMNIYSEEWRIG